MRTRGWATTDVGLKRDHNEDSYLCNEALNLYGVADGMGGHLGGERASRLAVEILEREIQPQAARLLGEGAGEGPSGKGGGGGKAGKAGSGGGAGPGGGPPDLTAPDAPSIPISGATTIRLQGGTQAAAQAMRLAVRLAAQAIYEEAQRRPELSGMGTTLTAAMFHGDQLSICHVGDSRAYLYRDGRARQLTEDHSWVQQQIRAGLIAPEDAIVSRFRNVITRSVGFEPMVEPDLLTVPIELGDCLLLCSDGLSNYLSEEDIAEVLTTNFYGDAGPALVNLANERGGDDNITCVLVYVGNEAPPGKRTNPGLGPPGPPTP